MSKKDIAHYVHYVFYTKFGRSTRVEEDRTDDLLREHVLKGNMNIARAFPGGKVIELDVHVKPRSDVDHALALNAEGKRSILFLLHMSYSYCR